MFQAFAAKRCLPFVFPALFLCMSGALAEPYGTLLSQKKYAEVSALAGAALARDPDDAGALVARSRAIVVLEPETRLDEAIGLAERCVAAHPKASICHDELGRDLGARALRKGIMASLGSAGTIRESFRTAVQLDPQNMSARFDLLQYYLQAPGIVGGGRDKALALVAESAKVNAAAGLLMQAQIDKQDGRLGAAETRALAAAPAGNDELADQQRDLLFAIAWRRIEAQRHDEALRIFREIGKRFPAADGAPLGIGVVLQAQGRHQEALTWFQQAAALTPTAECDYFMALSWQALNDRRRALASFEKALAAKPGLRPNWRTDALARVKELKG